MEKIAGFGKGRAPGKAVTAILWYCAVREAVGASSASELESRFSTSQKQLKPSQHGGRWARYSRGVSSPSASLVTRVGDEFPHTTRWTAHPLGDLLDMPSQNLLSLRAAAERLPTAHAVHLMATDATAMFWLRPITVSRLKAIGRTKDFDGVAAMLIALSFAEIAQDEELHLGVARLMIRTLMAMDGDYSIDDRPRHLVTFICAVNILKRLTGVRYRLPKHQSALTDSLQKTSAQIEWRMTRLELEQVRGARRA